MLQIINVDPGTYDKATFKAGAEGKCENCPKLENDHYGSSKFCSVRNRSLRERSADMNVCVFIGYCLDGLSMMLDSG
ncbi:hypothetical protein GUITHDRAFT_155755 [Guillardia theta CCMP2712]|uniref:Uncharacterized protein n=1 Tax=Guillardia theta (strain CCMP2712) TaxID=905079 RepID=L1IEU1_GUITC|nr:hypothetical protein GUITHDRAFT_155755 [Guillardia theta CCMP2712]EKX34350.1 hypothetical protein GUITHDRAFT_155755 [Guillardia theta CCMP2712]|eukprot:XP_005821330.1 hypothetical protein GUITHDRAFT_155755 [Guillardia theta CCMP2712]